jgi:ATP-dependent Lon protease
MSQNKLPALVLRLPIVALRDIIIFPGSIMPVFVGREKSMNALASIPHDAKMHHIIFLAQKLQIHDDPKIEELFDVGVVAKILQTIKLPNNNIKLLVEAEDRVKISKFFQGKFLEGEYKIIRDEDYVKNDTVAALMAETVDLFKKYAKINKAINPEVVNIITEQYSNPSYLSNIISSYLTCKVNQRQELLEITNVPKRLEHLINTINAEIAIINADTNISTRVKKQIEKTQKDYYLNEQIKAIQKELGEDDKTELQELEQKILELEMSPEAKDKAEKEIKKLKTMNPMASEAGVVRSYLDALISLPWGCSDKPKVDIKKAAEILNRDHYGLDKVKERIIEYLSVLQRAKKLTSSVICFIGPPGVGKTSLAKSIAEAVGRKYTKFALGGVRDEAEIRGHRRTYLGSMPGKIIKLIKKVKTNNPVMLLDEIDKIGSDFRGDPSSALLEVLDPEQNKSFVDHYLDIEYDLSEVMFIATANSMNISRPLLDRMEIIRIDGYIEDEKQQIALNYLIPKQFKAHNIKNNELIIQNDALLDIIRFYTKESGVRNLEREIASITRKSLKKILSDKNLKTITITKNNLEEFLGVKKYRYNIIEDADVVGSTTGLAYTEVGGDLLSIEAVVIPGKGEIKATGKLGEVMKESTQAAFSFFCSQIERFGLTNDDYKNKDIHLHVPEGATPKDGPSAGVAIFTTIVSLMTGIPVKRDVAMTGEITLRGYVLPIGGLKEKLLAASRGGIKTVIIPKDNLRDLTEIPDSIKQNLNIVPVSIAMEALSIALSSKLPPNAQIN